MSRIFDALRRVEQMKSGKTVDEPLVHTPAPSMEMLESFTPEAGDLENLARISCRPEAESHVLGAADRDRAGLERFRLLRYRLYRLRQQRSLKTLLVTSAVPRDGKTTVAVNLAACLAQASERVLLADADLRKPSLHSVLGLHATEGLGDCLQHQKELLHMCRRIDPLGFCFLSAGTLPENPVELLQAETMRNLVKAAAGIFDWVVIDSPPVLNLADARFLANLADAVIVVAREEHTRREELQGTLAALKDSFMAGIVLNTSSSASAAAYSYYAAATRMPEPSTAFGKRLARGQA